MLRLGGQETKDERQTAKQGKLRQRNRRKQNERKTGVFSINYKENRYTTLILAPKNVFFLKERQKNREKLREKKKSEIKIMKKKRKGKMETKTGKQRDIVERERSNRRKQSEGERKRQVMEEKYLMKINSNNEEKNKEQEKVILECYQFCTQLVVILLCYLQRSLACLIC